MRIVWPGLSGSADLHVIGAQDFLFRNAVAAASAAMFSPGRSVTDGALTADQPEDLRRRAGRDRIGRQASEQSRPCAAELSASGAAGNGCARATSCPWRARRRRARGGGKLGTLHRTGADATARSIAALEWIVYRAGDRIGLGHRVVAAANNPAAPAAGLARSARGTGSPCRTTHVPARHRTGRHLILTEPAKRPPKRVTSELQPVAVLASKSNHQEITGRLSEVWRKTETHDSTHLRTQPFVGRIKAR